MFNKTSPLARHNSLAGERDSRAAGNDGSAGSRVNPFGAMGLADLPAPVPQSAPPAAPLPPAPEAASLPPKPAEGMAETGSRLIVGPNVKLKGAEILDCDTLVVEGRVEATMDSRVLKIAEQGAYSGKVGIDIAEIHGHFDGELTVRQQLVVHATGRVSGTIRYGKILVEEGGELSGDVQSLSSPAARGEPARRALVSSV